MVHILVKIDLPLVGQLTVNIRLPRKRRRGDEPWREPEIASPVPTPVLYVHFDRSQSFVNAHRPG